MPRGKATIGQAGVKANKNGDKDLTTKGKAKGSKDQSPRNGPRAEGSEGGQNTPTSKSS